jgi:hypothetical protein
MTRTATTTALALFLAAGAAQAQQQYELHVIEALSTFGIPEAYLSDINEHGRAVGSMTYTVQLPSGSYSTTYKAYEWTVADGPIVDVDYPSFNAINNHGDVLAQGGIRLASGGTLGVPVLPGDRWVSSASLNDHLVVGGSSYLSSRSGCRYTREAFYWTPSGGAIGLETQIGIASAETVSAVNNNAQLVGYISHSGICSDAKAYYYDIAAGEHIDLNMLLNGDTGGSNAYDISDAGIVAGEGWTGSAIRAWTWTRDGGFVLLDGLAPAELDRATPYAVNSNGVSVGMAFDGSAWNATMWSPDGAITNLNDLVSAPGGFMLDRATAINDRGDIVGFGHFGPGWAPAVAFYLEAIGEACAADFDGDGALTLFDFLAFQNAFDAGDAAADFDGDGSLTIFDFLAFQNAFDAGC